MAKKEAHHGGAWKVAYADFVTTMMALFMVLWISVQDHKILIATSRYFQSPFRSVMDDHSGIMPFNKQSDQSNQDDAAQTPNKPSDKSRPIDVAFLNSVAADFYRLIHVEQDLEKRPMDVTVTSDGLSITLFDRSSHPLFQPQSAEFTEWGRFVMQNLAWLIDRHGFHVTIDGHTRSHLSLPRPDYSAWELSADRANAARRALVRYAVAPEMIERVSGYADTRPIPGESPDSETNQRITLSLSLSAKGHADNPAEDTSKISAEDHPLSPPPTENFNTTP
jgi:chemotaxis protein MotB